MAGKHGNDLRPLILRHFAGRPGEPFHIQHVAAAIGAPDSRTGQALATMVKRHPEYGVERVGQGIYRYTPPRPEATNGHAPAVAVSPPVEAPPPPPIPLPVVAPPLDEPQDLDVIREFPDGSLLCYRGAQAYRAIPLYPHGERPA